MIAEAISARTILTATNKIIFVEKPENVNVSAEFIKYKNRLFLLPVSISPFLVLTISVIPRKIVLRIRTFNI